MIIFIFFVGSIFEKCFCVLNSLLMVLSKECFGFLLGYMSHIGLLNSLLLLGLCVIQYTIIFSTWYQSQGYESPSPHFFRHSPWCRMSFW